VVRFLDVDGLLFDWERLGSEVRRFFLTILAQASILVGFAPSLI
jgi:hypothetical protein